ncbi:glucose-6-phosphate dehydrogenase [Barnesiella viscericola]|uniref:glucose-6-phosphate dehydrogenase n=1 Tax=Barnesiella viscericola TaxID=397865 RepID=UPI0023575D64|nr:glucose-6-phosphate dehydrogenase [Barnesiella viscericola]
MNKIPDSQILVIFGASGDLTHRKLMPALFELFERKLLPEKFLIVGVARTRQNTEEFRQSLYESMLRDERTYATDNPHLTSFLRCVYYIVCETTESEAYEPLFREIEQLRNAAGIDDNLLFYLATPPIMYSIIPPFIQAHHQNHSAQGWRRIIIEKPYGSNEAEARQLDRLLGGIFPEREIYRIDHFLGKETVQNILVLRFANAIWEPLWNRNYIDHIEITATETLGVEQRGSYYDSAGALRDMVQSHLLQIMAFIAMEPPANFEPEAIRDEISKVFRSLRPLSRDDIARHTLRGQYTTGVIDGQQVPAYREEAHVDPQSATETFVALKLFIDNWRWADVPVYIYTGKRLAEKRSEAVIHFRNTPRTFFPGQCCGNSCNQLVITLQPDESIRLRFGLKQPGSNFEVSQVSMDFFYKSLAATRLPGAYERLLLDAMRGDALLYSRSDALELSWHFLAPLLDCWEREKDEGLITYPAGCQIPHEVISRINADPYLLEESVCSCCNPDLRP